MCFLISIFLCFALVPKLVPRTVDFHWYWYRILKFWYRDNPSLMHTAHLAGNTSRVSKSSSDWLNYTGFPGDMWVAFFNVPPGNKDAVMPNSFIEEESRHVYNCDNERLQVSTKLILVVKVVIGFLKVCEISISRHRIFKICPRVLHTGLLLWRHYHAPKHDAPQNETWLVALTVSQKASWAGLGHSKRTKFPDLQPSAWRSGYARLGLEQLELVSKIIFL